MAACSASAPELSWLARTRAAAGGRANRTRRLGDVVHAQGEAEPRLAGLALGVAAGAISSTAAAASTSRGAGSTPPRPPQSARLASRAVEQADAELALEPGDLLAERGLRDVHARRGAAEVKLARERHECAQQPRVERHAPSL